MGQSTQKGREFIASLPAEDRGPALGATAANVKSGTSLKEILTLAGEVTEQDRAAPMARIAARIAQSTSLSEGAAIFDSIPFSSTAERAGAARDLAIAVAINKRDDSPVRQEAAWEWLAQNSPGNSGRLVQAEFLSSLSSNDAAWALERFESIGGASAGQEILSAFLKKVPLSETRISERYFDLATRLTDPGTQEAVLSNLVGHWKQADPAAAREAVDAASLPPALKARLLSSPN